MAGLSEKNSAGSVERGFRYVAAELRRRVRKGEWEEGDSLPSLRSLATHYDVGLKTARLAADALRREGLLTLDRRHRMVVAEVEDSWIPTPKPVLFVVGWYLSRLLRQSYSRSLLEGLSQGLERQGHELLFCHGQQARRQKPHELLDRPLHGIVLFGLLGKQVVRRFESVDCPVVLVDRPIPIGGIHKICVDNIGAAADATHRMLDLGHRNVACIHANDPDAGERRMGFLKALHQRGIQPDRQPFVGHKGDMRTMRSEIRKLFIGPNRCTAVLSSSESDAQWIRKDLLAMGLSVPEDVSITCFVVKGGRRWGFSGPMVDFVEMGRQAFALLNEPKLPARIVRFPTTWTEGKTLAPPRSG